MIIEYFFSFIREKKRDEMGVERWGLKEMRGILKEGMSWWDGWVEMSWNELEWVEMREWDEWKSDTKSDLCQAHNVFHDWGINVNIGCEALASIINVNI